MIDPTILAEHSELIDRLGGPTALARRLSVLGKKPVLQQSVSIWRKRGIPHRWRAILTQEANGRGIGVPPNFFGETPPPASTEPPPKEAPFL